MLVGPGAPDQAPWGRCRPPGCVDAVRRPGPLLRLQEAAPLSASPHVVCSDHYLSHYDHICHRFKKNLAGSGHITTPCWEGVAVASRDTMAPPAGFEPATQGLEVLRSVQLSYEGGRRRRRRSGTHRSGEHPHPWAHRGRGTPRGPPSLSSGGHHRGVPYAVHPCWP